jgi:hypothetical protein
MLRISDIQKTRQTKKIPFVGIGRVRKFFAVNRGAKKLGKKLCNLKTGVGKN